MKRIIIIFYKLLHLIYKMLLFSYGANSIKKIKERIGKKEDIFFKCAYIENYVRIFSGKSTRWDNGGISSIYYSKGKKVYGIALELSDEELNKLNHFEKGYHLEIKDVIIYVKDHYNYYGLPSNSYLLAINDMLNERNKENVKNNKKIILRKVVDNKVITFGYWTLNFGYKLNNKY